MIPRTPTYDVNDPRRESEAREIFSAEVREVILKAVASGWREAEAALALADAADEYILYLAERPQRKITAANSN